MMAALSAPDQPSATMAALEQLAARLVGFKVLTLMAIVMVAMLVYVRQASKGTGSHG